MQFIRNYIRSFVPASLKVLVAACALFHATTTVAQEKKKVEVLKAGSLVQSPHIPGASRLLNDVVIRHQEIMMYCDSAYTYEGTNRVDAYGSVHINQGDTLHLYADEIFYDGDISFAQAIKNVKLKNNETTLLTDTLDYDLTKNIGFYNCFGTIIDSTNTLSSQVGKYYVDEDMVHFTDSVKGDSEKYTLNSDNIKYNTVSEIIYFEGPTTIQDTANTLYAEDGWYNTQTGEADLKHNPKIYNETQELKAHEITYNQADGNGQAIGQVRLEDFENRTIVAGNKITYSDISEMATATDSAMFISYTETDSLFLHADTLRTMPDTIPGENLIKAYYGVRFHRPDVQGVCDSLVYFTKDSTVQLISNPVIWSEYHQLSADIVELKQRTNSPDEMHLFGNSFIISEQDTGMFDQIKGKDMVGFIKNNELDHINVDGNGQTLYYAREKEGVIGMNRAESSNITIGFKEGKISRIKFDKKPDGKLTPLPQLSDSDKKLSGFKWLLDKRPTSRFDIFRETDKPTEETEEAEE